SEHPGPQAWQRGQVDLHCEAACGSIDRGYDFGNTTGAGSVQAVDLNRNALIDPDETEPRLVDRSLQSPVTLLLQGEQRRARRGEASGIGFAFGDQGCE